MGDINMYRNYWTKTLLILSGILCVLSAGIPSHAIVIEQAVLDSVVQITTSTNETGTGFLIGELPDDAIDQKGAIFLVTNKHMLGCWNPIDGKVVSINDWLSVRLYARRPDHSGPVIDVRVPLTYSDGSLNTSQVAMHPDASVDIAVVRMEQSIFSTNGYEKIIPVKVLKREYFKSFDTLRDGFTDVGNLVFALGYPFGITSMSTNRPVAKTGYLAAIPGRELALDTKWKTCDGKEASMIVRGKLLLIDGLIVPGNSGGPVLLPAGQSYGHDTSNGQFQRRITENNRVIGIVSSRLGPSGLTYAYSTDYIDELITSLRNAPSRNQAHGFLRLP